MKSQLILNDSHSNFPLIFFLLSPPIHIPTIRAFIVRSSYIGILSLTVWWWAITSITIMHCRHFAYTHDGLDVLWMVARATRLLSGVAINHIRFLFSLVVFELPQYVCVCVFYELLSLCWAITINSVSLAVCMLYIALWPMAFWL